MQDTIIVPDGGFVYVKNADGEDTACLEGTPLQAPGAEDVNPLLAFLMQPVPGEIMH